MGYLEDRAGLAGKVAVVTGGAGGLGWPISRDFARAGSRVAVCDRDPDAVERARTELEGLGAEALVVHADVRDAEQMEDFFGRIDDRFGRVDSLVDVPGGGFVAAFTDTNAKGWQAILRQNLLYVFDTTQRAVERMRAQGDGGSIVYITSIEAHRAVPGHAIYGACKAGVTNLAKSLALELGADRIRVNTVAPDVFVAPRYRDPQRHQRRLQIGVPLARNGEGEDLSGSVLFLASDLADYITGTTVHLDGGTIASSGWQNYKGRGWSVLAADWVVDAWPGDDVAEAGWSPMG